MLCAYQQDFLRALELISDDAGRAEIRTEMSLIFQKDNNLWRAEKELALAVRLDDSNASSWCQLGVCRAGLGYIEEGCKCYKKAISLDPKNYEAWLHLALARKEESPPPPLSFLPLILIHAHPSEKGSIKYTFKKIPATATLLISSTSAFRAGDNACHARADWNQFYEFCRQLR